MIELSILKARNLIPMDTAGEGYHITVRDITVILLQALATHMLR